MKKTISSKRRMNKVRKEKVSHIEVGPSLSDLPDNILVDILLRLTVKRIFVCKSLCKTWCHLISDPYFAKLHFDQAQVYPLLRSTLSSRVCLVQPEFERTLEMNYDRSPINVEVDSKFKLPLHNIQKILDNDDEGESENHMKLDIKNHVYAILNSCNGLLCLSSVSEEPLMVCNPVSGEFVDLPEVTEVNGSPGRYFIGCGFGFSPASNQYKVIMIRMSMCCRPERVRAEVHTLGTETWRVIPFLPNTTCMTFPTYVNGCVYWLSRGPPCSVTWLDVEKECFESISLPPLDYIADDMCMGVLGGELFISTSQCYDVRFWVMKDNSAIKSWSQIYPFLADDDAKLPFGSYQLIKYLNNGALLMFNDDKYALTCKDTRKTGFKYLKVTAGVEAIPHIPSFVPLKYALSGHIVKVLNVRCAELKLHIKNKVISITEEDFY